MDKRKILEEIIKKHMTIKEASEIYDCSVSTLRKYIASLSKSTNEADITLYQQYLAVAKENSKVGRIRGGVLSKKESSLSKKNIKDLFNMIVKNDYTLRQLEEKTGISKSNLYDLFIRNLNSMELAILKELFAQHHENAFESVLNQKK